MKNDRIVIGMKVQLKNQKSYSKSFKYHDKFNFQNGLLYHDGLLYAPNGPIQHQTCWFNYIRFWIQQDHGISILRLLVLTNFGSMWKNLLDHVMFVLKQKKNHHHFHGLFQPLSIPTLPSFLIFIYFIKNLSPSNSCNSILVAVECLMKMAYFIP